MRHMSALHRVTAGDCVLAYRESGSGDPVLLLHSGFVADSMATLLDQPALRGHRLVAYHRRGYGSSDPVSGPRSIAEAAEDAFTLLDVLGVERAQVVGHSVGAVIAVEMALTEPARVGSLVVMEPLLGFLLQPEAAAFVADTAATAMPRFAEGDSEGALDAWLTGAFGPGYRAVLDQSLPDAWAQAVRDAATAFGVELAALQGWPREASDLEEIRTPTLSVVHPDASWPGFGQIHDGLLARVPGCAGVTVDLPSHLLQIAGPAAIAEGIAPFLTDAG